MKTTKQRLLNIVITMSVGVNLVMLGGLGYIASINHNTKQMYTAMNAPVVVYVPQSMAGAGLVTSLTPATTQ